MATALTALGIDTVLPAFPEIREAMDLPADSTQVATLVTIFLLGQGLGVLPAGLLADRFGRRPVLWGASSSTSSARSRRPSLPPSR